MKFTLSILSMVFLISGANALSAEGDSPAPTKGAEAGGALVEKKTEKVAPKKKAKKAKAEKKEKVAVDIGKTDSKVGVNVDDKKPAKRSDGLVITDLKVGSGVQAKLGSKITVHYKGTLMSGKVFDSSYDAGEPIAFGLDEGALIKGWTEGIPGMKVGGKRKLFVPYAMAYGEQGTPGGPIPPKSDLNFEVELIKVE